MAINIKLILSQADVQIFKLKVKFFEHFLQSKIALWRGSAAQKFVEIFVENLYIGDYPSYSNQSISKCAIGLKRDGTVGVPAIELS